MPRRKGGRPTKLTKAVTTRFLEAIRLGSPYVLACNYAGISFQTFQNWRDRTESKYVAFFESLERTEGEAVARWLEIIEKHAQTDGKFATWKLERRYPQMFGRVDHIEATVTHKEFEIDIGGVDQVKEEPEQPAEFVN